MCVRNFSRPADRSQIVFEVKPWEADTDLKGLFEKIRKVCRRSYVFLPFGSGDSTAVRLYRQYGSIVFYNMSRLALDKGVSLRVLAWYIRCRTTVVVAACRARSL